MAQSQFTKHEKATVERYLTTLVTLVNASHGRRVSESQAVSKSHELLQKVKQHRFLDTHPREVEGRIKRYAISVCPNALADSNS